MFRVNITVSVYEVIFAEVKGRLENEHNKGSKLYQDVITHFYVQLLNISETLKLNPYSFPELVRGYRYVMNYPINLIYKIEDDKVLIVDGITPDRWNQAYQKYLTTVGSDEI